MASSSYRYPSAATHEPTSMKRWSKLSALEKRTKRSLKYCDWYNRRRDLFLSRPYESMSLDTIYKIDVLADGQSEIVRLQEVIRDETLDRSLITRKSAEQTRGARRSVPRTTMAVINGQELSIEGTIDLRWWLVGTAVTHEETFYLVDSCGGYDGIFRADIGPIDPCLGPGCATLVRDKETEEKEKAKRAKKQVIQDQRKTAKDISDERIRQNARAQRENGQNQRESPRQASYHGQRV